MHELPLSHSFFFVAIRRFLQRRSLKKRSRGKKENNQLNPHNRKPTLRWLVFSFQHPLRFLFSASFTGGQLFSSENRRHF